MPSREEVCEDKIEYPSRAVADNACRLHEMTCEDGKCETIQSYPCRGSVKGKPDDIEHYHIGHADSESGSECKAGNRFKPPVYPKSSVISVKTKRKLQWLADHGGHAPGTQKSARRERKEEFKKAKINGSNPTPPANPEKPSNRSQRRSK